MRDVTEAVMAPRTVMLKSPFGSPMGRPKEAAKQTAVLKAALAVLEQAAEPGVIYDPGIGY